MPHSKFNCHLANRRTQNNNINPIQCAWPTMCPSAASSVLKTHFRKLVVASSSFRLRDPLLFINHFVRAARAPTISFVPSIEQQLTHKKRASSSGSRILGIWNMCVVSSSSCARPPPERALLCDTTWPKTNGRN